MENRINCSASAQLTLGIEFNLFPAFRPSETPLSMLKQRIYTIEPSIEMVKEV